MAYIGTIEALRGIALAQSTDPAVVAAALMKSPAFDSMKGPAVWRADHPADVPQVRRLRRAGQGSEGAEGSQVGPRPDRGRVPGGYHFFPCPLSATSTDRHRPEGEEGLPLPAAGGSPPCPKKSSASRGVTKRFDRVRRGVRRELPPPGRGVGGDHRAQRGGQDHLFQPADRDVPPHRGSVRYRGEDTARSPAHGRVRRGIVRTFRLVSSCSTAWRAGRPGPRPDPRREGEGGVPRVLPSGTPRTGTSRAWSRNVSDLSAGAWMGVGCLREKALWKPPTTGDKRKLEIALALCLRPSILLLDEPFAGLSDVEIVEVLELIRRVRKEFTLVIIEHKISRIVDLVSRLWADARRETDRRGWARGSARRPRWSGRCTGGGRERDPADGRRGRTPHTEARLSCTKCRFASTRAKWFSSRRRDGAGRRRCSRRSRDS